MGVVPRRARSRRSLGRFFARPPGHGRFGKFADRAKVAGADQCSLGGSWDFGGLFDIAFLPAFQWLLHSGAALLAVAVILAGIGLLRLLAAGPDLVPPMHPAQIGFE